MLFRVVQKEIDPSSIVETLFFSHPLFCTRSMLTAHSADDIHALCQSHDYAVLLRSQPVGRVVEDYFLCKTRVSQCVCRISYTCLAVRADYFHDGISPERYSACLHWCRSALGGHIADISKTEVCQKTNTNTSWTSLA